MGSSDGTDYPDLVQVVQSGDKVQELVNLLITYFHIESIPARRGWSKVTCLYDESKLLSEIKEAFRDEFIQSKKITDIAQAIITQTGKEFYLARKVQLLVFQDGWSNLDKLVGKNDCIVLIPVAISGSPVPTVQEQKGSKGERQTTLTFSTNSEVMISGRCSMWIPDETKVVCVVLCIGKDKG